MAVAVTPKDAGQGLVRTPGCTHAAPSQLVLVVGLKPAGGAHGLALLRWGLVPYWAAGVARAMSEIPVLLIEQHGLTDRVHDRGGEREVRFLWQAHPAQLPVWWNGKLHVVWWGNKDRREQKLPPCGRTWQATVESGWWSQLAPEEVVVPASFGLMNGVWFKVKQGKRGLLVRDRAGGPVVFLLPRPATRYYEVMTRAPWLPVLVDEVI